jgi:hypothetical protein
VDIKLKYEFRNVFSINWTNNFTILIDISAFKFDKHLFGSEILNVVSAYQFLPLSDVMPVFESNTFAAPQGVEDCKQPVVPMGR